MVLAFNNAGDFAKTVYGDSSSQHADPSGSIATSNPSMKMAGGRRRRSQRQSQRQRRQQRSRRQRRSQRQRGGK
jgi:hypothetical protein